MFRRVQLVLTKLGDVCRKLVGLFLGEWPSQADYITAM
jgi:hypothetical protein